RGRSGGWAAPPPGTPSRQRARARPILAPPRRSRRRSPERKNASRLVEGAPPLRGDSLTSVKAFNRLVCFLRRVDWRACMRDHPPRIRGRKAVSAASVAAGSGGVESEKGHSLGKEHEHETILAGTSACSPGLPGLWAEVGGRWGRG